MGTYVVTGSASGMGAAVVSRLREAGHEVIGVDLREAEVVADLSTAEGRASAGRTVLERAGGRLDGAVLAAGVGPMPGREELIAAVNYSGVVELLEAWRPALAAAGNARVVVFSSNSTTTVPAVPGGVVRALLKGDRARAIRAARRMGKNAPAMVYAGSKIAVTRWMRRNAVTAEWAGAGIRLNAIAPGAILTPLLQKQLSEPEEAKAIESFPVPVGGFGDPAQIADWVLMMLGPSAGFLCGAVIFVDGGTDAYFRADDWPVPLGLTRVRAYMRRMKEFRRPA
ncbi:SDR family oxidoreductase [Microbacterium lushaniae]|uniref:SDR family oxidoreductase n=1 Tax=Microbacterium lushaniae TaxID=2614639 RepID=A0A5J6L6U3_9MICO|nr:SDR family oxidoreductase [Microbacterium lushaniae]QEW04032.1 SDR family oxidoreductase [Microbacterium lushaniae]